MSNIIKVIFTLFLGGLATQSNATQTFDIEIQRLKPIGHPSGGTSDKITGLLSINGEYVGKVTENKNYLIPGGKYKGYLRYFSPGEYATSAFGSIGHEGDFLLEAGHVENRTNILFHTGTEPGHSLGCILMGGRLTPLPMDHLLVKMRQAFYGTDLPNASPAKQIKINIIHYE